MRSMLFVPGDRPERFGKAAASGADAVILDLEDAVVAERRSQARTEIAAWLRSGERKVPAWVRINPVDSDDALADLAAIIDARPDGIVLPKARDGSDVERAHHWLESLEVRNGFARGSIGLLPLITESAGALLRAASFVSLPARVVGLTWGAEDLAADIGAAGNKTADGEYELTFALARSFCLLAAAAAGVAAFDTIDTDLRDAAAIERRARASRRQGFAGKLAIHPAQVAPIHAAFSPTPEEIERAERVIAAFRAAPGAGAVAFEGGMLDKPHLRQAERILAARSHG
jgi:citrate lyase subunit beta/citryl-CoA lyase